MTNKSNIYVGNLFDDYPADNMPMFDIENRRYLGCKNSLGDIILPIINNEAPDAQTFLDLFAGTGVVGSMARKYYPEVIFNDFFYSNYVSFNAFFPLLKCCILQCLPCRRGFG